jgi:hypothetical protein
MMTRSKTLEAVQMNERIGRLETPRASIGKCGLHGLVQAIVVTAASLVLMHGISSGNETKTSQDETAKMIYNRFKMLTNGIAEHNLWEERLPSACRCDANDQPLSSWRYTLLPYLGKHGRPVYFDQPWKSDDNQKWAKWKAWYYCYDADDSFTVLNTGVVAVVGSGTAFEKGKTLRLRDLDGDTILIVESRNSGLHWMEPGDLDIRDLPVRIGPANKRSIWGNTSLGVMVGFADQEVWFLRNDTPMDVLKVFFTVQGAKQNDRDVLQKYRIPVD